MNSSFIKPEASMMENEVLIHRRWSGSPWISNLTGHLSIRFSEDLGAADFQTSPLNVLLLIHEDDYVANSRVYKTKLAKFIHAINLSEGLKGTVICIKSSELTDSAFVDLQSFCVIDLGLHILPIRDIPSQLPQLLIQFSASNSSSKREKNPFKLGLQKEGIISEDARLISTLSSIHGLSEKKARRLLEEYGSIAQVSEASISAMSPLIGSSASRLVYDFFNTKRHN